MSSDSIHWDNNGVLEFTDTAGVEWRFERYGNYWAPTSVAIWRDDVLQGEVGLEWSGSSATEYTWESVSDWATTDSNGNVINTSLGEPNEGGGEEDCGPEDPEWPDCEVENFAEAVPLRGGHGKGNPFRDPVLVRIEVDGVVIAMWIDPDAWQECADELEDVGQAAVVAIAGAGAAVAFSLFSSTFPGAIVGARISVSVMSAGVVNALLRVDDLTDCLREY